MTMENKITISAPVSDENGAICASVVFTIDLETATIHGAADILTHGLHTAGYSKKYRLVVQEDQDGN